MRGCEIAVEWGLRGCGWSRGFSGHLSAEKLKGCPPCAGEALPPGGAVRGLAGWSGCAEGRGGGLVVRTLLTGGARTGWSAGSKRLIIGAPSCVRATRGAGSPSTQAGHLLCDRLALRDTGLKGGLGCAWFGPG